VAEIERESWGQGGEREEGDRVKEKEGRNRGAVKTRVMIKDKQRKWIEYKVRWRRERMCERVSRKGGVGETEVRERRERESSKGQMEIEDKVNKSEREKRNVGWRGQGASEMNREIE